MDTKFSWKSIFKHVMYFIVIFIFAYLLIHIYSSEIKSQLDANNEISQKLIHDLQEQILVSFQQAASGIKDDVKKTAEDTTSKIKSQLDKNKEILLKPTPDLQEQILVSFRQTASDIKDEAKKATDATSGTIIANAEKQNSATLDKMAKSVERQLLEQGNNTNAQLALIKSQVDYIGTNSNVVYKILTGIQKEKATKAALYLEAARAAIKTPETAQILYMSALTYSNDKAEILSEFVNWQTGLIKQNLDKGDIESAQERLTALAGICDANIASGSISDMNSIPSLKDKLTAIEKLISASQESLLEKQRNQMTSFAQRIEKLSSFSEAEELLKALTSLTVDPSLNDQKDTIAAEIILKESCLTAPTDQLIIPAINDNTPWNEWLKNFIVRLQSDLPVTKKLEDIGTAAEFLQAAKESNADGVNDLIAEFEKVSRRIYLGEWKERAERITSSSDANLNDVSTLITESNLFSSDEQKENMKQIIALNKYITQATLKEFEDGLKHLKSLENSVSNETYMQMVAMTQGQYIQLLMRLKALDGKFANNFSGEISDATQKISSLGQLINSYKKTLTVADMIKHEEQRSRFVEWAKSQLNIARDLDGQGEEIASDIFTSRSNEKAVEKYKSAWKELMSIHPGDLQAADPALYQTYSILKEQIEKHCPPSDNDRENVTYKRLSDFEDQNK